MPAIIQRKTVYVFASLLFSFLLPASVLATPFTWQGPYVGVYIGGGFGNNRLSTNAGSVTDTSYFTTTANINAVNNTGTWTKNPDTAIVGIQAGHDWVCKQMVYGVVVDYGTLHLSSSRTETNTFPNNIDQYSLHTTMRTNWLFTLDGKLGYQTRLYLPSLFYFTGGMAITQLKVSNIFNDNSALVGAGDSSHSQNEIGWTAGIGLEVAIFENISLNVEYKYINVPSVKTTSFISNTQEGFGIPLQSFNSSFATTGTFYANIFKIGLNYRFDE